MKIIPKISILFFMFLIAGTIVYAGEPEIKISSDNNIEAGTTKTAIVKVVSDTYTVGTIIGKIETNDKIEKIEVGDDTAGLNGWSVTYNPDNKLFVAYKASGTNNSDIMQFSYTVNEGEIGSATITLSDLELSCLSEGEYITKNISNVTKTVMIETQEEKIKIDKEEEPTIEKEATTQSQKQPIIQSQQKPTTFNQQRPILKVTQHPTVVDTEVNLENENEEEMIFEEELTSEKQEDSIVRRKIEHIFSKSKIALDETAEYESKFIKWRRDTTTKCKWYISLIFKAYLR